MVVVVDEQVDEKEEEDLEKKEGKGRRRMRRIGGLVGVKAGEGEGGY